MITRRPLSPSQIRKPIFAIQNFVLLFALCALPLTLARAQSSTATLSGTVEDQNGALVPGANITVLDVNTRRQRETTTNDQGYFVVPLLPPTTYKVSVARTGFATVEVQSVVLNVGDQKSLQIQLKPGDISEMVQIAGDAALINTSPAVATTIDRTFVGNLPLNGRSFSSLVLLTPGVAINTSNVATDAGQFSVNGQRASTNYFTVDGASANFGTIINTGGTKS
ncbi:MAG TPA: carboxypeptidase-like regulatory domain-containing protein [Pyrinomonadaceae bacterium]|nr:carboxypeptidase-like regulatory domain-containing protein [Pyrinomonadaceae bacterium]